MTSTPAWGRYVELRPDTLAAIIDETPVAYVPWGALEWHGPHLPFGVDGFTAEALCERVARRTGGVILPTTWWSMTTLPHRFSLSVHSDVMELLWDSIFAELTRIGCRVVVLISGHYAQGHELVLIDAAEHAIAKYNLSVLAVPPLALVDETMLDHAALWETALMLALRPRMVDIDALGKGPLKPATSAVLGQDPRRATPTQGESALLLATERLVADVNLLLKQDRPRILQELYTRRRAVYRRYVEQYFHGSWEDAIQAWWNKKTET